MVKKDFLSKMEQKLLNEKKNLEAKIAKYSAPEESMENPDWDDLGYDAVEDILEENIVDNHKLLLGKINHALEKIKDGTYGKCEKCGFEFDEKQLEMVPWAEPCNKCGNK